MTDRTPHPHPRDCYSWEMRSALGRPIRIIINRGCSQKTNLNSQRFDLLNVHCCCCCCCCCCSGQVGWESGGCPPSYSCKLEDVTPDHCSRREEFRWEVTHFLSCEPQGRRHLHIRLAPPTPAYGASSQSAHGSGPSFPWSGVVLFVSAVM